MRKILALLILLPLAACDSDPVSSAATDNQQVKVDLLFTHDGCKVYRFHDGGYNHYFSDCRGSTTTSWTQYCGKGCYRRRTDEIPSTGRS